MVIFGQQVYGAAVGRRGIVRPLEAGAAVLEIEAGQLGGNRLLAIADDGES